MKKNNQGFMLVEALVMSTVVIGVLVFMFIQFRNISRGFDNSFSYNTVPSLYYTNEIKSYLIINNKVNDLINDVNSTEKKYVEIKQTDILDELWSKSGVETIIFADEGLSKLKGTYNNSFSEKFNDYINYLKVNGELNKYRLLVEFKDETFASLSIGGE